MVPLWGCMGSAFLRRTPLQLQLLPCPLLSLYLLPSATLAATRHRGCRHHGGHVCWQHQRNRPCRGIHVGSPSEPTIIVLCTWHRASPKLWHYYETRAFQSLEASLVVRSLDQAVNQQNWSSFSFAYEVKAPV